VNYLPIFVDLKSKNVLVIGAGEVAFHKIMLLLQAKAIVNIISKEICLEIKILLDQKKINWISKEFKNIYLNKVFLVIVATNDKDFNKKIFQLCNDRSLLVNVVDDKKKCSFIFPSIVNRSPIVISISSSGTAPVLIRLLREKIESILPIRLGLVAKIAGDYRSIVKKNFINLDERRHFWERLFKSVFVEYIINNNEKKAIDFLKKLIKDKSLFLTGEIILVGAGPGDSGLLTLRGLQVLQQADVVLYDNLVSKNTLELIRRDAKKIYVGKKFGFKHITQKKIIEILISLAKKGKKVVRLKGGDSFIFGRGGEEIEAAKKAGVKFQVIPGITAAIGIAAYTGIPLTHRKYAQGVIFITGHKCIHGMSNNWSILSDSSYTLVVYMGKSKVGDISKKLIFHNRSKDTPVAIVSQGTTSNQNVIIERLDNLEKIIKFANSPSLLIIGDVVLLHKKLKWFHTNKFLDNTNNASSIVNLIGEKKNV